MTHRENLLRAMRRQKPERVPFYFELCPSQLEQFRQRTGETDYAAWYDMPMRKIYIAPTQIPYDFRHCFRDFPENGWCDEWGVGYKPGSVAHFTQYLHPFEEFDDPRQILEFPLPDVLADYRWEQVSQKVSACQEAGLAAVSFAVQIFEPAWYLRGLDNLLADMMTDPEMAAASLDRMTEIQTAVSRRAAECGFDVLVFGDDVGMQRSMMMAPELWRKWLKPTMQRAIGAAKAVNPDALIYYHSDGVIWDIIPDLIEIGVDILNPVQPECMDPAQVSRLYGDRLSFWGTVGTQTTMPFGSPADVAADVRTRIATVGRNGGLTLAPTHLLEPEVPFENIEAFVRAVKEYGEYRWE